MNVKYRVVPWVHKSFHSKLDFDPSSCFLHKVNLTLTLTLNLALIPPLPKGFGSQLQHGAVSDYSLICHYVDTILSSITIVFHDTYRGIEGWYSPTLLFYCCYIQWLESIARLPTRSTEFPSLSSSTGDATTPLLPLSPFKPTASVLPQRQSAAVTESPAVSETHTDYMETEPHRAETTASIDANVSSLETSPKDSLVLDTSLSDIIEPADSSGAVVDSRNSCVQVQSSAMCCDTSNCCDSVALGDHCQVDSCHSDGVWTSSRPQCSDYEAASVLSDMQHLTNIVAAATSLPTPSTTFSTTSDVPSTSLYTAVNCGPAVSTSSSSSGLTGFTSGQSDPSPSILLRGLQK